MQEQIVGGGTAPSDAPEQPGPTDAQLEAMVRAKRSRRDESGVESLGDRDRDETLKAAAKGQPLTEPEIADALDFYFAAEADPEVAIVPTPLTLNLGTKEKPRKIRWEVLPVPIPRSRGFGASRCAARAHSDGVATRRSTRTSWRARSWCWGRSRRTSARWRGVSGCRTRWTR